MKRVIGLGGIFFKAKDPEEDVSLVRAASWHQAPEG